MNVFQLSYNNCEIKCGRVITYNVIFYGYNYIDVGILQYIIRADIY